MLLVKDILLSLGREIRQMAWIVEIYWVLTLCRAQHFICIISLNPHDDPRGEIWLSSSFTHKEPEMEEHTESMWWSQDLNPSVLVSSLPLMTTLNWFPKHGIRRWPSVQVLPSHTCNGILPPQTWVCNCEDKLCFVLLPLSHQGPNCVQPYSCLRKSKAWDMNVEVTNREMTLEIKWIDVIAQTQRQEGAKLVKII